MTSHILIIADGRSPTAKSWIENIRSLGYAVSLISTYHCEPPSGLRHFSVIPVAFSRFGSGKESGKHAQSENPLRKLKQRLSPALQKLRYIAGPLTLFRFAGSYRQLVEDLQPDLVHALRLPFEGLLAAFTPNHVPCLMSTWGNDLTLHAKGSRLMLEFTQRCLRRADGLFADTRRDLRLAASYGFDPASPTLVVPGSGGLDLAAIQTASPSNVDHLQIPRDGSWVINPRGWRPGSVHQDVFFAAIPQVLAQIPNCRFICPSLKGNPEAEAWVDRYNIQDNTTLLPRLPQSQLWSLYKLASVFVSPSSHDGTPNTLLEAMACGCFPVVGNIESLREWITDGVNGLLVDPHSPDSVANGILTALKQKALRQSAADRNLEIVRSQAAQSATLPKIKAFYAQFLD